MLVPNPNLGDVIVVPASCDKMTFTQEEPDDIEGRATFPC